MVKSKSKRKGSKKVRRTKTSHKFLSKSELGLGECRGKRMKTCKSDPNCSYRKRVGCVRKSKKKGSKKRPVYYGPTLSNIN